jgi:1-acyl-sn-glycerol-3-phosphate acyltransferase
MKEQTRRVDPWGRTDGGGLMDELFRAAYRWWFRVEWEGLEHVPRQGGALLVSNHAGMLPVDGGIIQQGIQWEIGRPVYSLAHDGFWRFPFIGSQVSRVGGVVGHPENADRLLRTDQNLVLVFPEGAKGPVKPPRERYRLQRFGRGGFVETAMRAGVPIVPIALMGTEDTTPTLLSFRMAGQDVPLTVNALMFGPLLGAAAHFPAKIRARALPPIHFDEPVGLEQYPRSVVMDHAEEIRGQMQSALDSLIAARTSVLRG